MEKEKKEEKLVNGLESYCRYEARRSTGGEGSGDELPKKHFTAVKRAL